MFAIHSGKMQETRYLRDFFSLLILGSWLVTNVEANSTPFVNPWTRPPPLPPHLAQTRRTASEIPISYRLDTWSQYDNPEEGSKREGDIFELPQSRKTITKNKQLLWPGGVVKYYVHSSIANEPMKYAMLENAMDIIMSKTCVKFERIYPDETGELPPEGWVNITGNQNGCFSDLGRSPFAPSVLNLNVKKCFRIIGHAIHEILHTLGVYHEHMRPDRDDHITIIWENIRPGDAFNFRILNESIVTDYGLPYDYDSIMHYSMTAFSKDRTIPTIIPMDPHVEIGQRNHLSHYDTQKLLITYKCNDITEPDKENKKYTFTPKRNKVHQHKLPAENVPCKIEEKTEAILTIQNRIANKLEDSNHIDFGTLSGDDQKAYIKHKYRVRSNYYPLPLIYSPIYPHIHFHIHNN